MSDMNRDKRWATWDEWRNDETCDEWHVINCLWPYTFCEIPLLNPFVNHLLNPFLIAWGQTEWRYDETWDEWHEIEIAMSERHPETLLSYSSGRRTLRGNKLLRRGWAEVPSNNMRWQRQRSWPEVKCGHPRVYRQYLVMTNEWDMRWVR